MYWLIALALATALVALGLVRRRKARTWGFRELVRRPQRWSGIEDAFAERRAAIEAAPSWTQDEVDAAVLTVRFPFPWRSWETAILVGC